MQLNNVQLETLHEEKVKEILLRDANAAKKAGKKPFWSTFNENLSGAIKDPVFKNNVFLHAVKSLQFATKSQPLAESTTSTAVATYNKAMLPTIITRVFPKIVVTNFIATRQLDVPTQVIQTFRLARNTAKDGQAAGDEFFDPQWNKRYNTGTAAPGAPQWQGNVGGLDPFYSSQQITGEIAGTSAAAASLATVAFAPVLPGTLTVYTVSDTDPRIRTSLGVDNGLGVVDTNFITAINYVTGGITYGAGNVAPAAGYHYEFDYRYNQERNKNLSEITFKQSLINVNARSRKNYAQISAEAIQDLEAYSEGKLDGLKELVAGMTESMALEIDQELTLAMMSSAAKLATYDNYYAPSTFRGTQFEKNQELIHKMNFLANDIAVDFLRGDNMFAVCHPHVFTILQNTNEFRMLDVDHSHQGEFQTDSVTLGKLSSGFTVAKAPQFPQSDKMLLGYTSKDLGKAPYAYFPYVTYLTPPSMDVLSGDIFSSVVGLQQRYDHQILLDGQYGLGVLTVQDLYN